MPPPPAVRRPSHGSAPPALPRGTILGRIHGPVTSTQKQRRFHGPKLLGLVLLLTIVLAPAVAVFSGSSGAVPWFVATEVYAVTLLIGLLILGRRRGTALGDVAYSGRLFLPRRQGMPNRRTPVLSTEVLRFEVETFTGESRSCVLVGRPSSRLKDNDYVRLTGRKARSGEVAAREIVVLSSAVGVPIARVAAVRKTDYAIAARLNRVCFWLVGVLTAGFAVGAGLVW